MEQFQVLSLRGLAHELCCGFVIEYYIFNPKLKFYPFMSVGNLLIFKNRITILGRKGKTWTYRHKIYMSRRQLHSKTVPTSVRSMFTLKKKKKRR